MVMSELLAEWRKEAAKHTRVGNVCIQAIEVASPVLSRQTILELASVAEEEYKAAVGYATRIKQKYGQHQLPGMGSGNEQETDREVMAVLDPDTPLSDILDGDGNTTTITFNGEEVGTVGDLGEKIQGSFGDQP